MYTVLAGSLLVARSNTEFFARKLAGLVAPSFTEFIAQSHTEFIAHLPTVAGSVTEFKSVLLAGSEEVTQSHTEEALSITEFKKVFAHKLVCYLEKSLLN